MKAFIPQAVAQGIMNRQKTEVAGLCLQTSAS